jgi:hypothetical protein
MGAWRKGMSQTRPSKLEAERRSGLAVALTIVVLGAVCASPATAWDIYSGEKFNATLDSTFTFGAAWRVQDRNYDQIYLGNDPDDRSRGIDQPVFSNSDDGNLNYKKGELYSASVKGTFDLEVDYRHGGDYLKNVAGFFRATAFYDFVGDSEDYTQRTPLEENSRRRDSVIDGGVVGAQWLFLDAYLQGTWELADRMMDLRAGNQVLSWGEGLFTPGGINAINAFDVTKLRIPGSELKEALVPAPMLRVSGQIYKGLGIEAYYQFYWNRTNVDPTGSYWASNDLVGRAAVAQYAANDAGSGCFDAPFTPGCQLFTYLLPPAGQLSDVEPSDQGQGGVALRYYWDRILTEFGAYYLRYHSKTPTVGSEATNIGFPAPSGFFREYGDKIDVVGASFATEVLAATLAGEISYRWDDPTPIVAAGLASSLVPVFGDESRVSGAVREKRLQAAINLIQSFGPSTRWGVGPVVKFLRADSFSLTSEMAVVHYFDLSKQCDNPFIIADPRNSAGCVPYAGAGVSDDWVAFLHPDNVNKSSVDATSLGYQLFLRGEYTNPLGIPITLNPTVGWRHDFHGVTPNQTFIEGRKAVVFGLEVDYLRRWGGKISYANFFGAKDKNLGKDRDFVSLSVSYAF